MWKLKPLKHSKFSDKLVTQINGKSIDLCSEEAQLLLPNVEDYTLDNLLASNVPLSMQIPSVVSQEDMVNAANYLERNFDNLTNPQDDEN